MKDDKDKRNKKKKKEDEWRDSFDDIAFNFDAYTGDFEKIFEEILPQLRGGSFGRMMDEMIKNLMRTLQDGFDASKFEDFMNKSYVYGFNIGVDDRGKPVFRQFGNVKPQEKGDVSSSEYREPLIDIFKEKENVRVIAEVPGIEKGDIKLTGKETSLTINAQSKNRKYEKTIELPVPVKIETAKAKYKNGVLEVIIERKEKGKKDEVEINID